MIDQRFAFACAAFGCFPRQCVRLDQAIVAFVPELFYFAVIVTALKAGEQRAAVRVFERAVRFVAGAEDAIERF